MNELLSARIRLDSSNVEVTELPFITPVHLPFGTIDTRPSSWLTVEGQVDGRAAYGAAEGTALPMQIPMYDDYSGNLARNINSIVQKLPYKEQSLSDFAGDIASMKLLGGNFATARMTVESALIDMIARSKDKSVIQMLQDTEGNQSFLIPYGKSIAENNADDILAACHEAVSRGAKRLKFKLSPENFDELFPALTSIIQEFPDIDCMVDANGMFDPENPLHIEMLHYIDKLNLMTIEEPVSRVGRLTGLDAHRALQQTTGFNTPITMDDAIKSVDDAYEALDTDLAQIVNLKPGRMGSFLKCIEIAEYAKSQGKEVMVGGMFEATPGRMMTLTLAAYCLELGFKIPGDVSLPQERLNQDLVTDKLELSADHDVVFQPKTGWGYSL